MFSSPEESVDLISRVVQPAPYLQIVWNAPLAHWEGVVERIPVVSVGVTRLKAAWPAPAGLRLRSDNFYWAVSACENSVFHFNVFRAPDEAFQKAQFPSVLFELDSTGVPVNPVRRLIFGASDPSLSADRSGARGTGFTLQIDKDGFLQ